MALNTEEKAECISRIEDLLLHSFHGDFQDYYTIVVATCSLHPEQVNNELRNMLTHVARALDPASADEWESQLEQAENHLERAKRDCLKLANLEIFKELKQDCFYIQMRDGKGAFEFRAELIRIEDELKEARRIELGGRDATVDRLLEINADLQELRVKCQKIFVRPGRPLSITAKVRLWLSFQWHGAAVGLAVGLLVSFITALLTKLL